jgi:hypothetical protein
MVDGYDVIYTHRGSWKANRSHAGKVIDVVPVAWDRDYVFGDPPLLIIWFQDPQEASRLLHANVPFVAALATKKPGGASSRDIKRLFVVEPVEEVAPAAGTRSGLRCRVVDKVPPPHDAS